MQKRSLKRLWKQIILFLSKLAGFLRGNGRRLKRRRHLLRDEVTQSRLDRHIQSQVEQTISGNAENDEASITSLESHIQSQVEQTISGNENVLQNVEGNNNINVGRVEGSLTINYRRPIDRPFQAPSLPPNFVDRPQVTVKIKARLLANTSSAGALLISAIHGLGGIGKTTLVTALAHDEDIQKRFSGGVLWATLGQEPDILALLSSWVQALGDYEFRANNIEATSAHLRSLLHDKAVLLVVDDAWEPDYVKPFMVASSQSQLLITSRRADVADAVGAYLQQLNLMTPAESLELLSKSLERQIEGEEKQEALRVAKAIQSEDYRAYVLSALAEKLPPELLLKALDAAKAIQDEDYRARALSALAEKLPPELLPKALAAAKAIQPEYYRAKALSALAEKLPPELLPEALAAAKAIQNEDFRADALSALAEKLPPELLPEALAAAKAIQDEAYRAYVLSALAEKLPDILPEALAAAKAIQNEDYRAKALSALAEKLPELLPEALAAARAIQNEVSRASALSALAEKLPEFLPEAFAAAKAIQSEAYRALCLEYLAKKLPPELLPEALAAAKAIQDEDYRAKALNALAEKLPELLPEALAAAKAIQSEDYRANALSALAEKLPELLPEALAAAKAIQNEYSRAEALSALVSGLSQMPVAELFPLWQDTLHELSLRTRPDLLQDINALFPVIFALGSEAATAEVARAIVDVARWWR